MGCGSGNFTLLMAQYSQQILGLDFSPAMLAVLEERRLAEGIGNIRTQAGKWEDFTTDAVFDYIVSVNSHYRIRDIKSALLKIARLQYPGLYHRQNYPSGRSFTAFIRKTACPVLNVLIISCCRCFYGCLVCRPT